MSPKINKSVPASEAGKPLRRGRRLIALMRGKGAKRMTTDQIMALTRG